MPLELNRVQVNDGVEFRLVDGGKFGITLQALNPTGWQGLYSFDLGHVWPIDIEMGNHFASTHPDVLFTHSRVATLANPSGKVTLLDFCLREFENGEETRTGRRIFAYTGNEIRDCVGQTLRRAQAAGLSAYGI
jgi:N-hydroxyarylamine O-acetyltransferase